MARIVLFVVFFVATSGFARPGGWILDLLFRAVDDKPSPLEVNSQRPNDL